LQNFITSLNVDEEKTDELLIAWDIISVTYTTVIEVCDVPIGSVSVYWARQL